MSFVAAELGKNRGLKSLLNFILAVGLSPLADEAQLQLTCVNSEVTMGGRSVSYIAGGCVLAIAVVLALWGLV
ncbi:MAG: hypothetical protein ACUVX8_18130, partial [Candidatus Zipacnadales bacterium]